MCAILAECHQQRCAATRRGLHPTLAVTNGAARLLTLTRRKDQEDWARRSLANKKLSLLFTFYVTTRKREREKTALKKAGFPLNPAVRIAVGRWVNQCNFCNALYDYRGWTLASNCTCIHWTSSPQLMTSFTASFALSPMSPQGEPLHNNLRT